MQASETQATQKGRLRLSIVNVTDEPSGLKARSAIKEEVQQIAAGYQSDDLGVIRVFATIRQVSQIGHARVDKLLNSLVATLPALQTIQLIQEPGPLSAEQMMARSKQGELELAAVIQGAQQEENS